MTPSTLRMSMRILDALSTGPMSLSTLAASVCRTKPNVKTYTLKLIGSGHVTESADKLNRWPVYTLTGKPLDEPAPRPKRVDALPTAEPKALVAVDLFDDIEAETAHEKKLRVKFKAIVPFADAKALPRKFFRSVKCKKPKAVQPTMR